MNCSCKDACDLASWPARERINALKRIIPRRKVEGMSRDCGVTDRGCGRVPEWFMLWFHMEDSAIRIETGKYQSEEVAELAAVAVEILETIQFNRKDCLPRLKALTRK